MTSLVDAAITADLCDTLRRDKTLCHVPVEFSVCGGVVHAVAREDDRREWESLREVFSRQRGVHGVWLRGQSEGFRGLDLGCGGAKQWEGAVGLDFAPAPAVDIRADADTSIPVRDSSIDCVFAVHFLEHVRDLFGVMDEIHRVLKPEGMLHVMVPDASHVNAVADPTHIRFFNVQTFKYFCRPQQGCRLWYPALVSTDGASVFADLAPVPRGGEPASDEQLARFFS